MPAELSPIDKAKFVAAKRAVEFVESGMKVGLGTGSTAAWMVRCLGERIREEGLKVVGVPTSSRTAELARQVGVPITTLDEAKWLDLTIDGADEFDPNLALIKGGGAALLQEKIVATASDQMIVITDAAKPARTLLAEYVPAAWARSERAAQQADAAAKVLGRPRGEIIIAAAWLHAVGESPSVSSTGFAPIDGAVHLLAEGWPTPVVNLVAHQGQARLIAPAFDATC